MKRPTLIVIVILVMAVLASSGPALAAPIGQANAPTRTITVTGIGTVFATPDVAGVNLGVQTSDADVLVAMKACNDAIDAIIAALEEIGLTEDNLRTNYFVVYQDVVSHKGGDSGVETETIYRVANNVRVTVTDVKQIDEVIAVGVEAGATIVSGLSFSISDRETLEDEAMDLAIADAQAQAEKMAEALGLTVGTPLSIQEGFGGGGGGGGGGGSTPTIIESVQSITRAVTITFEVS
jgi:uncharacterized protein YggE